MGEQTGGADRQSKILRVVRSPLGYTKGSPTSGNTTLDRIVGHCQAHDINVTEELIDGYPTRIVRVGNIAFRASSHDTGCGVTGWIIDGDEAYEFLDTTYWYSSTYIFNKSKWDRGAWDDAVTAAIDELREKVIANKQRIEEAKFTKKQSEDHKQDAIKARFGAQFAKKAQS
jgi:hypothetical protein